MRARRQRRAPTYEELERAAELRRALQEFARRTEVVARRHGLTTERYQLLLFVKLAEARNDGPSVNELASELHLAPSTMTQLVRRAENLRLLRRELAPHDARIRYLRLTEEGERRLVAAFTELGEERKQLAALLAVLPGHSPANL